MLKTTYYSLILFGISFISIGVLAGTFTPSPAEPGVSAYNLSDVYNKISSSTYEYSTHIFSPTTAPASTFNTLAEIWDAISWKTLTNSGTIDPGFYATTSLEVVEPNLVAGNIKNGVNIFGVAGNCVSPISSLLENLIAYYPLDVDVNDYSGLSKNGANHGATPDTGQISGGYYFDGGSNAISVDSFSGLDGAVGATISSWIKPQLPSDENGRIVTYGSTLFAQQSDCFYCTHKRSLICTVGTAVGGSRTEVTSNPVSLDNWHHVACIYDGSDMKIYVDNMEQTTTVVSSGTGPLSVGDGTFYIGDHDLSYVRTFKGIIDELSIFDKALSETEINLLFNGGSGRSLIH